MLILDIELPETNTSLLNGCKKLSIAERIPAFGLICALISTLFSSLQSVIVKLANHLHPIEILFIRVGFQFIIFSIVCIINNHTLFGPKQNRLYLAVRCVTGTVGISCIYVAFKLIPIADAITIFFSSSIIVTIIAYFIFKEPLTLVKILTIMFSLTGVICIAKPEFIFGAESAKDHLYRLEGTTIAIIGATGFAVSQVLNQKINATPVATTLMWFSLLCLLSGIIIVYILDELVLPSDWRTWWLLLGSGICGVCEFYFVTVAFRYEKASAISVTSTFNIVFTFIWANLILSEPQQWTSIIGACIVSFCIVVLAIQKLFEENSKLFDRITHKLLCTDFEYDTHIEDSYNIVMNKENICI